MNFRIILYSILAVVACLVIAFVAGFFMPGAWQAQESIVIQRPPTAVQPLVDAPRRWPEWFPWNRAKDPSIQYTFSGPESGPGAVLDWNSEKLGHGTITIRSSDPATGITYDLVFKGFDKPVHGGIAFVMQNGATIVTWTEGGELGVNPIARLFRALQEANLRVEFKAALERLKALAEAPTTPTGG